MHNYLTRVLQNSGIVMSPMQQTAYDLIQQKNNIFMNSQTGCGKTLAYLIPVLDNILRQPKNTVSGAVILTVTKELCMQTYREIRRLDPEGQFKVSRTGSISHFSSIIELLNKKEKRTRKDQEEIESLSVDNIIKSVNRQNTDILVTTPNLLTEMLGLGRDNFNPQFVVFDEADILFQNVHELGDPTMRVMQMLASRSSSNRLENQQRQFILSCSSFPPTLIKKQSKSVLSSWFNNLEFVENNTHQLPKSLKIEFRRVSQQKKLNVLLQIIKQNKSSRILVFCNTAAKINQLKELLGEAGHHSQMYMNSLSTQQRVAELNKFANTPNMLLLSTDLGSRGLDLNVDLIVEYDCTNDIVAYLNRAGRTARFNRPGKIISLVTQKNEQFVRKIQESLKSSRDLSLLIEQSKPK